MEVRLSIKILKLLPEPALPVIRLGRYDFTRIMVSGEFASRSDARDLVPQLAMYSLKQSQYLLPPGDSGRAFLRAAVLRPFRYLAQANAVLGGAALDGNRELGHRAGHRSDAVIPEL